MSISKLPTNASLKQVMDKFEEISLKDFSSIDIITAPTLPNSGREGQMCVITDVMPNKIYLNYDIQTLSETDIFIQYYSSNRGSVFVVDGKCSISLNVRNTVQKINGVSIHRDLYIFNDSNWKIVNPRDITILDEKGLNPELGSDIKSYISSGADYRTYAIYSNNTIRMASIQNKQSSGYTLNKIQVTGQKYLHFIVDIPAQAYQSAGNVYFGLFSNNTLLHSQEVAGKAVYVGTGSGATNQIIGLKVSIDIHNITGEYYIGVKSSATPGMDAETVVRKIYISDEV